MKGAIGVFDSGVGGLTVLNEIRKKFPYEDLIYFGDTARVPYGSKSKDVITKFSLQITRFFLEHNVKAIVVACNTASALAYPELKKSIKIPIFDVISPGAKLAISLTKNKKIGVIGTKATIESKVYEKMISSFNKDVKVYSQSCPLLVPLIEEGWKQKDPKILKTVLTHYLVSLMKSGLDTLILGCTHYPIIKDEIQDVMGKDVILVDSASAVCTEIEHRFRKLKLNEESRKPHTFFYVSDAPEVFIKLAREMLGMKISKVQKVDIEKY